ncbi:MAG TPA: hypothetical protein PL037_08745, partial [Elusimicrobiales bacterium]|nr:hypothetical protein [Elusimicrobiales bacterium]
MPEYLAFFIFHERHDSYNTSCCSSMSELIAQEQIPRGNALGYFNRTGQSDDAAQDLSQRPTDALKSVNPAGLVLLPSPVPEALVT